MSTITQVCCCHPPGVCDGWPETEHVHKCTPRGADMGHCYGDDFEAAWCCRSPVAVPVTTLCIYCQVGQVDPTSGSAICESCRWVGGA